MLDFRILGPLEASGEQGPIQLGGPKQRATLAILLLGANRVVSVERLADDLYAGAAPVTAVTQVQRQVSELRKALGSASAIETRAPGYVIRVSPEQLDLGRFERQTADAARALAGGEMEAGAALLREALALWRGEPLADLADEPFARSAVRRLGEIRLAAVEQRIDADLALGRHRELVAELEELAAEQPLRERFAAQLMLALYRAGRQAEALDVYRSTRERLVAELGIEPTPALRALERAILAHDTSLDPALSPAARTPTVTDAGGAVLVLPGDDERLDTLLAIAQPLAAQPGRELIVARLVRDETELERALTAANERGARLPASARTAVFTTPDPAGDALRLALAYDAALVLLPAPALPDTGRLPDDIAAIVERSPADVALLAGTRDRDADEGGVFVPFGGSEHDWAALELGACLAFATPTSLTLVGTRADPRHGRRDASRLLADAAVAVQRVIGVQTRPLLVDPAAEALVAAVAPASLVVAGLSPRWRQNGIGTTPLALVRDARPPVLLVHRGLRPGALAPRESRTRFTWSLEP